MADTPIYLFSVTSLDIHIYDTIFEGSELGSVVQGGLKVNSFSFPKIIVKDCMFNHLKYNDIAFTQIAALTQHPAALYIKIHLMSYNDLLTDLNTDVAKLHGYHTYIVNSTFFNNFRAIAINSRFIGSDILKVYIKDSQFTNNQVVNDGGGIYVDEGKNTEVYIENCEFISNKAGVNPFNVGLTFTGSPIGSYLPAAFGYEILSDNLIRLDMEFYAMFKQTFLNESIHLNMRGSGGAISIKHAKQFKITKSNFVNNTANNYGGAIYVGNGIQLIIEDTSFLSGEVPSTLVSGVLIQSYCDKFFLSGSNFKILTPSVKNVSAVYHSGENIDYSMNTKNITITCPLNTRLVIHNSTNDLRTIASNLDMVSDRLTFNDLVYTCEECVRGYYSLERGYFEHTPEIIMKRDKRTVDNGTTEASLSVAPAPPPPPPPGPPPPPPPLHLEASSIIHQYTYINVICHACPYGGTCNHGIQAKTNNWGLERNGVVTFYKCPSGYCCSETTCETYNKCGNHRHGTLCSKCEPGYSEALFSTKCLLDEKCNQFWFIPITAILIFIYAMFLLFQNNLKDYVLGAPIGKQTMKKTFSSWIHERKHRKSRQQPRKCCGC